MLNRLLEKFGYIHESKIDEEYLLLGVAKMIGDVTEYEISKEAEDEIFTDLAKVHGFSDYLKATMARDMQRHFSSPVEQQDLVTGAFARTAYFKSRLIKTKDESMKEETKIKGLRYG